MNWKAAILSVCLCLPSISHAKPTPSKTDDQVVNVIKTQDKIIASQMELIKAQRDLIRLVNQQHNTDKE